MGVREWGQIAETIEASTKAFKQARIAHRVKRARMHTLIHGLARSKHSAAVSKDTACCFDLKIRVSAVRLLDLDPQYHRPGIRCCCIQRIVNSEPLSVDACPLECVNDGSRAKARQAPEHCF